MFIQDILEIEYVDLYLVKGNKLSLISKASLCVKGLGCNWIVTVKASGVDEAIRCRLSRQYAEYVLFSTHLMTRVSFKMGEYNMNDCTQRKFSLFIKCLLSHSH